MCECCGRNLSTTGRTSLQQHSESLGSNYYFATINCVLSLKFTPPRFVSLMTARNTRYWRRFINDLLCPSHAPASKTSYDGVCVFTLLGRIEFRDGCFRASSSSDDFLDVDPLQFLAIFHQLTCLAIQEERASHDEQSRANVLSLTPAIRLSDWVFHVVSATFASVCAVASGKTRGLVIEKLPFGVLVVAFSTPLQLETVYHRVDRACAVLRR